MSKCDKNSNSEVLEIDFTTTQKDKGLHKGSDFGVSYIWQSADIQSKCLHFSTMHKGKDTV